MPREIDTILFDFDGTLVETNIDFARMRKGVISLGAEYGIYCNDGLYVLESLEYIHSMIRQKDKALAEKFTQRANKLIVDMEVEAASKAKTFTGALETLRELKDRGTKIGIVTRNCRTGVMKTMEIANFTYDLLLTRDDVTKVKPDPQHLLDALKLLNSHPERTIMVGDHPMDIVAGKKAGTKTAAVLTLKSREDFEEVTPDYILRGVLDLLDVL
jgi:phosphoglycolate phosphatase